MNDTKAAWIFKKMFTIDMHWRDEEAVLWELGTPGDLRTVDCWAQRAKEKKVDWFSGTIKVMKMEGKLISVTVIDESRQYTFLTCCFLKFSCTFWSVWRDFDGFLHVAWVSRPSQIWGVVHSRCESWGSPAIWSPARRPAPKTKRSEWSTWALINGPGVVFGGCLVVSNCWPENPSENGGGVVTDVGGSEYKVGGLLVDMYPPWIPKNNANRR